MTSPFVSLAQAGLPPIVGASTSITPAGVTFHYGGDALGWPWPHSRCPSIWRAWDAYHRSKGWVGIAYSHGACPHGFVFEGRGSGVRTAAQGTNDGNNRSYAVCALLGAGDVLTDECKVAMLDARALLVTGRKPAGAVIWPHNAWHSTSCPGEPIDRWIDDGAPRPGLVWAPPAQPHIGTPAAAFASTPTGAGYIVVGTDGGVFTFGDAMYFGSLPEIGVVPNSPIVAAAVSPSGGGYTLVGSDGGVYTFGDARFAGSLGGVHLNGPIEDMAVTPAGDGYWLSSTDGGVFAFGAAPFAGSAAA